MRIGFDVTSFYAARAGVFTYGYHLLQALLARDDEDEYLLLDYTPLRDRRAELPEITGRQGHRLRIVHCRGLRYRQLARWGLIQETFLRPLASWVDRTLLWPWSAAARFVMHRRVSQALEEVEVFHSSDVLLWEQPGALNVVTIHDLTALLLPECHTPANRELQLQKIAFAQEKADAIIAVSEATKKDILAHLRIAEDRVYVVYNGVSQAFHPLEDREAMVCALTALGLTPGYILHVGTIEPRKNLGMLIEAYARVRSRAASPPRLVLAGAAGWRSGEVFAQVESLGLGHDVEFLGWVPTEMLPALYHGAVFFVYPSLYEGFGLPPLEAMACGVPVVTSDTSALPEIVGDAGLLIPPHDVPAWADAMVELLVDADRRAALSARGLARARAFSWERAAGETLRVYHGAQGGDEHGDPR